MQPSLYTLCAEHARCLWFSRFPLLLLFTVGALCRLVSMLHFVQSSIVDRVSRAFQHQLHVLLCLALSGRTHVAGNTTPALAGLPRMHDTRHNGTACGTVDVEQPC
jgi:hypothetical protein